MRDVRAKIEAIDLRRLVSRSKLPWLLRYAALPRWPFAMYDSTALSDLGAAGNPLAHKQAILNPTTPLDQLPKDKLVLELSELCRRVAREMET